MLISCTHIYACTHLGGDSTDVDTSSTCAHTTRVSSADNRNNKHKQVVRPYKCMFQCRSDNTSGCTSGPHKPRCWSHDGHVTTSDAPHLPDLAANVQSTGLRAVHGWQLLDVVLVGLWWSVLGDGAVL